MRFLAAGDIHNDIGHATWVANRAQTFDVEHVLQLGDFGFWSHTVAGLAFLDELEEVLANREITFTVVRGNHDNFARILQDHGDDLDDEGFIRVRTHIRVAPDGHTWTWGGKRFIALGGAFSPDKDSRLELEMRQRKPGYHWFPEEEIDPETFARKVQEAYDTGGVDVIAAHDRPFSAMLPPGLGCKPDPRMDPNSQRLAMAIVALKPSLYVHGHLHVRYEDRIRSGGDRWTQVIGLSSNPRASDTKDPVASTILLDTDMLPEREVLEA